VKSVELRCGGCDAAGKPVNSSVASKNLGGGVFGPLQVKTILPVSSFSLRMLTIVRRHGVLQGDGKDGGRLFKTTKTLALTQLALTQPAILRGPRGLADDMPNPADPSRSLKKEQPFVSPLPDIFWARFGRL
jgi:hypothetical protein